MAPLKHSVSHSRVRRSGPEVPQLEAEVGSLGNYCSLCHSSGCSPSPCLPGKEVCTLPSAPSLSWWGGMTPCSCLGLTGNAGVEQMPVSCCTCVNTWNAGGWCWGIFSVLGAREGSLSAVIALGAGDALANSRAQGVGEAVPVFCTHQWMYLASIPGAGLGF